MVSKTGSYSAKFTGINIEGVNVEEGNPITSPVCQFQIYNGMMCIIIQKSLESKKKGI